MMSEPLSADVLEALYRARRTQGWNFRADGIQKFKIGRRGCALAVVPARIWSDHRRLVRMAKVA